MNTAVRSVVLLACLTPSVVRAEEPKIAIATLPDAATRFAIHPGNGTVAGYFPQRKEVVLYPDLAAKGRADNGTVLKIDSTNAEVVFKAVGKKTYLLVLAPDPAALSVFDPDKPELVKKVALAAGSPRCLVVSRNPDDPFAYYVADGRLGGRQIGRVDLAELADQDPLQTNQVFERLAVSADGATLYLNDLSEWASLAVEPATPGRKFAARPLHVERREFGSPQGEHLPDPFGQGVVVAGVIYRPDLSGWRGQYPQSPRLLSAARPVAVSQEKDKLAFFSANSLQPVGTLDLPAAFDEPDGRPHPVDGPTTFLEHAATGTLLLCRGRSVGRVAYRDVGLPDEPVLAVSLGGPALWLVGKPGEVAVTPRGAGAQVALKDGPKGLRLEKGNLVWTPGSEQVGRHVAQVEVTAGKHAVRREVALTVRQPGVGFSFQPVEVAVTDDGTRAVVLGGVRPEPGGRVGPRPEPVPDRIALVDLTAAAVIAERTLPNPAALVAIDEHHVYVAGAQADAVQVLSRKDLSDVKLLPAPAPLGRVVSVAGKLLFLASERDGRRVFKLPDLTPAEAVDVGVGIHVLDRPNRIEARRRQVPERVGDGWWFDGCLYDAAFAKVVAAARPAGFWNSDGEHEAAVPGGPGGVLRPGGESSDTPVWALPWAAWVSGRGIDFGPGMRYVPVGQHAEGRGGPTVLLSAGPAAAALRLRWTQPFGGEVRETIDLVELGKGTVATRLPLREEHAEGMPPDGPFGGPTLRLFERPGKLVALAGRTLYVVALPALDGAAFKPPLHFAPNLPITVLADKDLTLPLPKLVGAAGATRITPKTTVPGVMIDPIAGVARIDRAALLAVAGKTLTRRAGMAWTPKGTPPEAEAVATYLREHGPAYERLTGRKPAGVPIWVVVKLAAQNDDHQTAEIEFGLFVEVPHDSLKKEGEKP